MPASPKPTFPSPAAVLPGEADILANVLADLSDDHAKLVYADWLEERDDPRGPLLRTFVTAFRAGKPLPAVTAARQPWRDLVGITLMKKLRAVRLTDHTDQLLRLARPALTFKAARAAETALAVGASKLGGRPDLPPGTNWPKWRKEPLAFLAQFNLADLRASPVCGELPAAGVLSVFYAGDDKAFDNSDKGGWRVFHFPHAPALARRDFPADLDEDDRFRPCRVSFTEILTLPERDSPWELDLPPAAEDGADNDPYGKLIEDEGSLGNRLLGYASSLQNDVYNRKKVRHFLTVDSDDKPGWMWGDTGLLYFTIAEEHLRDNRFDRIRFEMQCC
jgi:uncharacterized protein (TIGR02996 family)